MAFSFIKKYIDSSILPVQKGEYPAHPYMGLLFLAAHPELNKDLSDSLEAERCIVFINKGFPLLFHQLYRSGYLKIQKNVTKRQYLGLVNSEKLSFRVKIENFSTSDILTRKLKECAQNYSDPDDQFLGLNNLLYALVTGEIGRSPVFHSRKVFIASLLRQYAKAHPGIHLEESKEWMDLHQEYRLRMSEPIVEKIKEDFHQTQIHLAQCQNANKDYQAFIRQLHDEVYLTFQVLQRDENQI